MTGVYRRGKTWSYVIDLPPDPVTKKRRQQTKGGFPTQAKARDARIEALAALQVGTYVEPSKQTVAEYLTEWLETIEPTIAPSTHYSYDRNCRLHVIPTIGGVRLQQLDAAMLDSLYAKLLKDGSKHPHRPGGLSPTTVKYVHQIVHKALGDAMRKRRLAWNPAEAASPPKPKKSGRKQRPTTWSAAELSTFLNFTKNHRFGPAWFFIATTGVRRGEALGLEWPDVDLDEGTASIWQTVTVIGHKLRIGGTKTPDGTRSVDLDPATGARLRAHRQRQLEARMLAGPAWEDRGLVFCEGDGSPIHPEAFSKSFDKQVARCVALLGLPRITIHSLRHTWATLALRAHVPPKVVQERLGHANVGVTLNLYSHVTPGMQREAADTVAGLLDV